MLVLAKKKKRYLPSASGKSRIGFLFQTRCGGIEMMSETHRMVFSKAHSVKQMLLPLRLPGKTSGSFNGVRSMMIALENPLHHTLAVSLDTVRA